MNAANLQVIRSQSGQPEYVLIPVAVYNALREQIEDEMAGLEAAANAGGDYVDFDPAQFVSNPVAVARIKAGLTQKELAERLGVSQPYVAKVEGQGRVTAKLLERVRKALTAA